MSTIQRHESPSPRRRKLLAAGGGVALLALNSCALRARTNDSVESRVARWVQTYDSLGDHRTATPGDIAAANWLADEARKAGADVALEPFDLSRVDPRACYASIAGRRIEGVPLFDASFTDERGITGRLGPLGSDAEIGVVQSHHSGLIPPPGEGGRSVLPEVRRSRHKAVILIARGSVPGLFLLNAGSFATPSGPPTLQVSSTEGPWLLDQAKRGTNATLLVMADRTPAKASNVVGQVAGTNADLAPIVVTTPRSAWWRCVAERGGGIACWMEVVRAVADAKPKRSCYIAAFSGHELSWLGGRDYLKRRPDIAKRAHLWLHFGANIGAPRQPNMLTAYDDGLEKWAAGTMEREGIAVDRRAPRGTVPLGEAALVHRLGGRYVAIVCDNDYFHHPDDRWPDAIDVAALARYARAFASGIVQMAQA